MNQEQLQPQDPRQHAGAEESQAPAPQASRLSRRRSGSSVNYDVCSSSAELLDQISFSTGE